MVAYRILLSALDSLGLIGFLTYWDLIGVGLVFLGGLGLDNLVFRTHTQTKPSRSASSQLKNNKSHVHQCQAQIEI